jgi:hypothetical protein
VESGIFLRLACILPYLQCTLYWKINDIRFLPYPSWRIIPSPSFQRNTHKNIYLQRVMLYTYTRNMCLHTGRVDPYIYVIDGFDRFYVTVAPSIQSVTIQFNEGGAKIKKRNHHVPCRMQRTTDNGHRTTK